MANIKKQFVLEGLCCDNCAAKIKKDVALLPGVMSAKIKAGTALLSVACSTDANTLTEDITRIAVSHDEDITVRELES